MVVITGGTGGVCDEAGGVVSAALHAQPVAINVIVNTSMTRIFFISDSSFSNILK